MWWSWVMVEMVEDVLIVEKKVVHGQGYDSRKRKMRRRRRRRRRRVHMRECCRVIWRRVE